MNSQLELSFSNLNGRSLHSRRQSRLARARSWFQLMRNVVDNPVEWQRPLAAPKQEELQQALDA